MDSTPNTTSSEEIPIKGNPILDLYEANKKCFDCENENPRFISVNNAITLCKNCCEEHKKLGNSISYTRSLEEPYDEYILTNSNKHNTTKEKTILLAIQACFLRISDEDATYIIEKFRKRQEINVNSHKIESLIYQEDVGNSTEEKGEFQKSFDYFLDIFDEVIKPPRTLWL